VVNAGKLWQKVRAALDIPATLPSTRKLQEAYASCLAPLVRNGAARRHDDDDDGSSDGSDGSDGSAPDAGDS